VTLATGHAVGPYEIVAPLGAGGMGEVYRARDPRLGREVAIKVLPGELCRDAERLRRFEREARAAAALNHPNILDVHDTGVEDGVPYIVSELLEGETLRERLRAAALPVRKAIDYAVQVAQGLAAAHEKDILHRDLKPENLFVTKDGRVKILDFGLAKLQRPRHVSESSVSRGETLPQTSPGIAVGTAGYMSPEQVRGDPVDARSDIFSFGAVLYEMLSGQRAFRGGTAVEAMNAILAEDPPSLSSVNPAIPPVLERIVQRCLEKPPGERFHSAHDLGIALQTMSGAAEGVSGDRGRVPAARARWRTWRVALPAAGLVAVGALSGLAVLSVVRQPQARPVAGGHLTRFSVTLPGTQSFRDVGHLGSALAISPDGRDIVYVAREGETTRLYHRPVDALEAEAIPGTEGARGPFFSSDGSAVGFSANGLLKKVLLRGGAPVELDDVSQCYGGDWGEDGTIVYALCDFGLTRIPASGGTPVRVTKAVAPDHQFPQLLRGGEVLLFTEWHAFDDMRIAVLDLDTGDQHVIIDRGTGARYVPTGHIVYGWAGDLWAVPFDLDSLEVTAPPVRVVENVLMERTRGVAHFAISNGGTLAFLPGGLVGAGTQLAWAGPAGAIERLPVFDVMFSPRVSPDGRRLLFHRESAGNAIWVHDLARGVERKLSTEEGESFWAVWTPDGKSVVFNLGTVPPEPFQLFREPADGSRPGERLTHLEHVLVPNSVSADGTTLAFAQSLYPDPGSDVWTLSLRGDGEPRPFLRERFAEVHPALSPDGRWMAYASNESGPKRFEVSVRPYPGPGAVVPISAGPGWEPLWSPDGRTLFYRNLSGTRIMAVSIDTNETPPRAGRPRVVVEGPFQGGTYVGRNYDLGPDGRFLVILADEPPPAPREFHVVLDWFEELKRLAPAPGG
jgi:hypothetical protein